MLTHHGRQQVLEHMVGWQQYTPPTDGLWMGFIVTDPTDVDALEAYQNGFIVEMGEDSWEGRQRVFFRNYVAEAYGVKNDGALNFVTAAGTVYALGLWDQEYDGMLVSYQILDEPLVCTDGETVAFNHERITQVMDVIV